MVRKTKEDAAITRQRIIDAARRVFLQKGVSQSSLEQIATQAGVTRGAVYWHFENKTALLFALREQVFLPLIDRMDDTLETDINIDPLSRIQCFLEDTIKILDNCEATRQTYEIMMTKCEFVDDLANELKDLLNNCNNLIDKLENAYQQALAANTISTHLSARQLALDTHLFFSGLLHMWVKDMDGTFFRLQAMQLIQNHIALRKK